MEVLEMVKRHYDRDVCMRCGKPLKESEGTADSRYLCSACRGRLKLRCSVDVEKYLLCCAIGDMER